MYLKILRQNKVFLSIIFILFLNVGFVVYVTATQVYQLELKLQAKNEREWLQTAKEVIEGHFNELGKQLLFMRDLPATMEFVDAGFSPGSLEDEVRQRFTNLIAHFEDINHIRIIDSSGSEMLKVINRNGRSRITETGSANRNPGEPNFFNESFRLDKDKIYMSSINMITREDTGVVTYNPTINLATPLYDSNGKRKGVIAYNLYFYNIFRIIPDKIFVKAEDGGDLMSLNPDGTIQVTKSDYYFKGRHGKLTPPDGGSIHYLTAHLLSAKRLLLGKKQDLKALKVSLMGLAVTPASLILMFIFLIGLVAYFNISRFKELISSQKMLIHSLADLTEWRDSDTGCHLERTTQYAVVLSRQLQKKKKFRKIITNEFIEDIADASLLHDMGKVGVKDSILLKPGKLTNDEYEQMKKHIHIGRAVLEKDIDEYMTKQSFLVMGKNICAYHHEKYNGDGYIGLKGDRIPLEARIFALCDAYDAIRAERPYEGEISHEIAFERITRDRGTHFDPDIVDAFIECQTEFLEISDSC